MNRQAAELLDQGHPAASAQCALAKKMATDQGKTILLHISLVALLLYLYSLFRCYVMEGFEVCNDALQLLGGYGYLKV